MILTDATAPASGVEFVITRVISPSAFVAVVRLVVVAGVTYAEAKFPYQVTTVVRFCEAVEPLSIVNVTDFADNGNEYAFVAVVGPAAVVLVRAVSAAATPATVSFVETAVSEEVLAGAVETAFVPSAADPVRRTCNLLVARSVKV